MLPWFLVFRWNNSGVPRDPICTFPYAPPSYCNAWKMCHNWITLYATVLMCYCANVKGKNMVKRQPFYNTAMLARIHMHIKLLECTECGKYCSNSSDINMLMRIHFDMKPHALYVVRIFQTCSTCIAMLTLIHIGMNPHGCTKCVKDFSNLFDLHSHAHKNSYWHGIIWMH